MAVIANTFETYQAKGIREDLITKYLRKILLRIKKLVSLDFPIILI